jgi:hypothetical protein
MFSTLSRTLTLIVTNTIKLGGLYVGVRELVVHSASPNTLVLAYSAFLVAGGQLSETTILSFLGRFFGVKNEAKG